MPDVPVYPKVAQYRSPEGLRERCRALQINIPVDDAVLTAAAGSPLAQPVEVFGRSIGNRWCIHPMEGWDGTLDGKPTDYTRRRWEHFGRSGAKLLWGGEAVAVRHEGRANPNQLMINEATLPELAQLREIAIAAHHQSMGSADDLVIGLQLTHSGRFCRPDPDHRLKPRIAYHHPLLDAKFGIAPDDDSVVISDDDLLRLQDEFVIASKRAQKAGFDFVDLKCCHGYLGHELLGGFTRPGPFGGSFENRTRFTRELIERVKSECPGLGIGVRLSAFDFVPFEDDPATRAGKRKGVGRPMAYDHCLPYRYAFGVDQANPVAYDLAEPVQFLEMLARLGVRDVNISCGSPYYNPHIQRPAFYPPSDGYQPPEDPLVGVARQIDVVRLLKSRLPRMTLVGTGYTYLQELLPQVAQAVVRSGGADLVGIGRMVLSYDQMPADTLLRGTIDTKRICRTFSDCTTAPRKGLISGCFPLDGLYKESETAKRLKELKQADL